MYLYLIIFWQLQTGVMIKGQRQMIKGLNKGYRILSYLTRLFFR